MLRELGWSLPALAAALLGILLLAAYAWIEEPQPITARDIGADTSGMKVTLTARVVDVHAQGDALFLTLFDGRGQVRAVVFRPNTATQLASRENARVQVTGRVEQWRGTWQIQAEVVEPA